MRERPHLEARWVVRLHAGERVRKVQEGVHSIERGHLLLLIRPLILAAALVVPLALHAQQRTMRTGHVLSLPMA